MMACKRTAQKPPDRCSPRDRDLTRNERAWIEFLRLASSDTDPPPTLDRVQRLRAIFARTKPTG